ncbi:hypothetical protein PVAND_002909 [Polypedilum vanderplanki]|uniref:Roadblock/LAMTOR2 domain-containing protein n=1 Tax=Polypedilum vanderplanki TaxID=319348 RepID=A0A9J6BTK6_POLVA|nr:hypothetical protein PVAND_002909 [Polypedilum vanderplanki]
MAQEIDSIMSRISRHQGVEGILLFNLDGICIKSYNIFDEQKVKLCSTLCSDLCFRGKSIIKDFSNGKLEMIRIVTDLHEYMIVFERDYIMFTIYKQNDILSQK